MKILGNCERTMFCILKLYLSLFHQIPNIHRYSFISDIMCNRAFRFFCILKLGATHTHVSRSVMPRAKLKIIEQTSDLKTNNLPQFTSLQYKRASIPCSSNSQIQPIQKRTNKQKESVTIDDSTTKIRSGRKLKER